METAFPSALVDNYQHLTSTMPNHVKDRHVAAAATAIGATVIVTSNIRDFRALPPTLSAVTPDTLFQRLWAENADLVRTAIQRQARTLIKPELTPDMIVERLQITMPGFARLWREGEKSSA